MQVHEDPADLLDGGYGAIVDGLEPMEVMFAAVRFTNTCHELILGSTRRR